MESVSSNYLPLLSNLQEGGWFKGDWLVARDQELVKVSTFLGKLWVAIQDVLTGGEVARKTDALFRIIMGKIEEERMSLHPNSIKTITDYLKEGRGDDWKNINTLSDIRNKITLCRNNKLSISSHNAILSVKEKFDRHIPKSKLDQELQTMHRLTHPLYPEQAKKIFQLREQVRNSDHINYSLAKDIHDLKTTLFGVEAVASLKTIPGWQISIKNNALDTASTPIIHSFLEIKVDQSMAMQAYENLNSIVELLRQIPAHRRIPVCFDLSKENSSYVLTHLSKHIPRLFKDSNTRELFVNREDLFSLARLYKQTGEFTYSYLSHFKIKKLDDQNTIQVGGSSGRPVPQSILKRVKAIRANPHEKINKRTIKSKSNAIDLFYFNLSEYAVISLSLCKKYNYDTVDEKEFTNIKEHVDSLENDTLSSLQRLKSGVPQLGASFFDLAIDTDFTIRVENESIPVHKDVLMETSPYFKRCLERSDRSEYVFPGVECCSPFIMKAALRYLYTGEHPSCVFFSDPSYKYLYFGLLDLMLK